MPFYTWAKIYLLTIPVFFAVDLLWLGVVARTFHRANLHNLLSPEVNWPAAFAFYFTEVTQLPQKTLHSPP